jgi:hypothetical protein
MARRALEDRNAIAKADKRASQLLHGAESLRARHPAREERDVKTRRYRLGQVLEGFLFDEPELLAQFKDLVQREPLEHVQVASGSSGVGRRGLRSRTERTRRLPSTRAGFGSV